MKHFLSLSFIVILIVGMLGACTPAQDPIRIGVIAYTQGDEITITSSGAPTVNGANLAVSQINEQGGLRINGRDYPVELVIESIENDVDQAVAATKRLIEEENVVAIVGPQYSGDAIAAGEVAEAAGVPLISGTSTNPRTTENRRFVFRATFTDALQAVALADMAFSDLGARRVAVIYDSEDAYSSELAFLFSASYSNRGGEMVARESFVAGEWNMDNQLRRIVNSDPELVFLPVYPAEAIYLASSLRKLGFEGTLLGGDGWDALALISLPAFEGSYSATTYSATTKTPTNQTFIREYRAAYNIDPVDSAGLVYDALNMLFAAIELKQSFERSAIRDGLYELPAYIGASGPIDFVENGDPVKPINILYYDHGELKFYKAVQVTEE